jgi:hypothetical protein
MNTAASISSNIINNNISNISAEQSQSFLASPVIKEVSNHHVSQIIQQT